MNTLADFPVCAVAAGVYTLGDDSMPFSRPSHTVTLSAFAISRTTVTNDQFASFVEARAYADEILWNVMGWRWLKSRPVSYPAFWGNSSFDAPQQPVVGLTWYEADAFSRWLSRETDTRWRLPTEAEWEAAARGPQTHYWPNDDENRQIINGAEQGVGRPWPAAQGNIAWCGAVNMWGNVWEWCSSRWGRNWQDLDYPYPYHPDDGREDLSGSHARIMRGGSWFDTVDETHPANRARYLPGSRASNIGFRLAHDL